MKPFEYKVSHAKTGKWHVTIMESEDSKLIDQNDYTDKGLELLKEMWWGVIKADNIGNAIELLIDRIPGLEP